MNHKHPLITDSGGFQVFSLAYGSVQREVAGGKKLKDTSHDLDSSGVIKKRRKFTGGSTIIKVSENGVLFKSYRDGSRILLTPEISVLAQKDLAADIIIPFDELPPYHIDEKKLRESFDRTHRYVNQNSCEFFGVHVE